MSAKMSGDMPSGKIVYNSSIVKGIVTLAVSEIEGVSIAVDKSGKVGKDTVKIEFNGDSVAVDVTVSVRYGYNIPDVAYNIQRSVKQNVEAMSDYKITNIDVHVINVEFDESEVHPE